jgi:SH3-like domain-containing protein
MAGNRPWIPFAEPNARSRLDRDLPMDSKASASAARDYAAQYPDPIHVPAGASVRVERPDEENPSWWWCVADDGRAGWVPGTILDPAPKAGATARVQRQYSARELSVTQGEPLVVLEEFVDWLLVRNAAGARGWVPASHIVR